ncbi:MAG: substrate-binding domain-containing protein [Pyrinomonadaceae bacterium]|nr:substrate-binding domain-containing protein [Pyrinomonadaceae bacterium]MCX7639162.1 substrate-binding domain-containing protein [Pyrinomonadaceae bacterium]MDW8303617.1 substrate-binding domain-containing protein [Acidobacteriota bacterium]
MKRLLILFFFALLFIGCAKERQQEKRIKIGFSMATLKEERWQRDKKAFEEYCQQVGVDCRITVANNDAGRQANDVENLLTQGIDVLVIAPHDAVQAATLVEKAKSQGVPVISYDRLIHSDKIDLYISHQVPVIGRKIAEYALEKVPKGNYVMVYGGFTDNNAHILKREQMAVLQPAIERKDIKIVAEQFINDWKREEALKFAENALTQTNDDIQAFVVSNDGMASGVIAALEKRGLAGKILVTGQDAEISALQSIAEGKQTMTIYKPIIPLAQGAINAAIRLAKKEPLTEAKPFFNETIQKEIPAILLEVYVVDKSNLMETVIKDGYADYERVYENVPIEQRPKR